MALKFLNKKGWHTGSLRNIENVWKAEQKHDAEQKKLEELRKQIHEERERAEFRQLQEQAGLIPRQERLDFLYESGLATGKVSGFKELDSLPKTAPETTASSSATTDQQQPAVPGALFDEKEKPQSANDAWRKLHSDPLLLIRQREQEALARVKNNPIQMAMIRKSVESKNDKGKEKKKHGTKQHRKTSKHRKHSSPDIDTDNEDASLTVEKQRHSRHRDSRSDKPPRKAPHYSDNESSEEDARRKNHYDKEYNDRKHSNEYNDRKHSNEHKDRKPSNDEYSDRKPSNEYNDRKPSNEYNDRKPSNEYNDRKPSNEYNDRKPSNEYNDRKPRNEYNDRKPSNEYNDRKPRNEYNDRKSSDEYNDRKPSNLPHHKYDRRHDEETGKRDSYTSKRKEYSSDRPPRNESSNKQRGVVKLSEEERAAKLREMQMDAEIHEEQRWKRLKKAADSDAQEAVKDSKSLGRNFLDATQKSVYGAEKGGSSTIEESVRRRTHYLQGGSLSDSNAFRR